MDYRATISEREDFSSVTGTQMNNNSATDQAKVQNDENTPL